jgi:hypothetical protein
VLGVIIVILFIAGGTEWAVTSLGEGLIDPDWPHAHFLYAALAGLIEAAVALMSAALTASLYVELRTTKEGSSEQMLAEVFT